MLRWLHGVGEVVWGWGVGRGCKPSQPQNPPWGFPDERRQLLRQREQAKVRTEVSIKRWVNAARLLTNQCLRSPQLATQNESQKQKIGSAHRTLVYRIRYRC